MNHAAVLGPGRIGRQIALVFALGGSRVSLVDVKERPAGGAAAVFADARREIRRDLALMAEEGVIQHDEIAPALDRIEDRIGLDGLDECGYVQEALPELVDLKRAILGRVSTGVSPQAIIASTSSTISPKHLADAVRGDERFLVVHWLNPAHIIPLVEEKIARNELGPKTGRGFFDYAGERREAFETAKVRALLRQLRRQREST